MNIQQKMNITAHRREERQRIMLENHRLNLYNNVGGLPEKDELNAKSWDGLSQSPKHSDSLEKIKKGNITIQGKNYNF